MPGGGWAGVATWVRNAEQGSNGLKLVSADEARPGDIAAYDWGGGNDFGADGHIGFLDSSVKGGKFTALEGNNGDAVNVVPRQLDDANIVFIRVEGDAPAGTAPSDPGQAAGGRRSPRRPRRPRSRRSPSRRRRRGRRACSARCPSRARWQRRTRHGAKPGDSNLFLQAVEAEKAEQQPQPVAAAPAADPPRSI